MNRWLPSSTTALAKSSLPSTTLRLRSTSQAGELCTDGDCLNSKLIPLLSQPRPSCPTGYHRVYQCCVPVCPATPPCNDPKEIDQTGQCVCPYGLISIGTDSCEIPECLIPGEERVVTPYGSYCTCQAGYELWNNQCKETCPKGQQRDATSGDCIPVCVEPEIFNYDGDCVSDFSSVRSL